MTISPANLEDDPRYREAVEWFLLMKEDPVGAEDRAAFAAWLASDPQHPLALKRAEALWGRFDIVAPEYRRMEKRRLTRRAVLGGAATGVLGLSAWRFVNTDRLMADHTTRVAERRIVRFTDGSTAEMGSYSALSADFSGAERRITLFEGQAFFDLKRGERPAIFSVANAQVATAEAKLDIRTSPYRTAVFVADHSAELRISGGAPIRIDQNILGSFDHQGALDTRMADAGQVMAWRQGRVIFDDVPLREMLSELGRYRSGPILFTGGAAGDLPVTGVFDVDKIEQTLDIIPKILPVRVRRTLGGVVIVSAA